MEKFDVSIVMPMLNEEENVLNAYNRIKGIMDATKYSYEIIFVNDGSFDNTYNITKRICEVDKNVRLINFSRNFGQESALLAGHKESSGNCVISLDIDFQEPPELIPKMLEEWEKGYKIVNVKRKKRKEGFFKRATAKCFYKIMSRLGAKNMNDIASFFLLDRVVVDKIVNLDECSGAFKSTIFWMGYKTKTLYADRTPRDYGKTKYTLQKMIDTASLSMTNTTTKPLYLGFYVSISMFISTVLLTAIFIVLSILKLLPAFLWLIPVATLLTAFITLVLGVQSIYLAQTFIESRHRPEYIIEEKINFDDEK